MGRQPLDPQRVDPETLNSMVSELELVSDGLKRTLEHRSKSEQAPYEFVEATEMLFARAGDVLLKLRERKILDVPDDAGPWLRIVSTGELEDVIEYFVAPGPDPQEREAASDAAEFVERALEMQEGLDQGDSLSAWADVKANFVRRHLFLEAVMSWLPPIVGMSPSRLKPLRWHIRFPSDVGIRCIEPVSDWLNEKRSTFYSSSRFAIASEGDRILNALISRLTPESGSVTNNADGIPSRQGAAGSGSVKEEDLPDRERAALHLFRLAQSVDDSIKSPLQAFDLLEKRPELRALMKTDDGRAEWGRETFRKYASEALRKTEGSVRQRSRRRPGR